MEYFPEQDQNLAPDKQYDLAKNQDYFSKCQYMYF